MEKKNDYSEDAKNFFFNHQNKKKEKKLKEKYGMDFMETKSDAPPEIINNFLNYVEQFEESWENAEKKKIIEILGFPDFKKLKEIEPEKLPEETDKVLQKYTEHNINVDIIEKDDVNDDDFYKFLTEELMDYETEHFNIAGMTTNFIYEDFHPSNKLDAKNTVDYFLSSLKCKDKKYINTWLSQNQLHINGNPKTQTEFINEMFKKMPVKIENSEIIFKNFEFSVQNKAEVDFVITYIEINDGRKRKNQKTLNLLFVLESSEFGGFNIREIIF